MFDQKMFEYVIDQKSWKNALDQEIIRINLDWEVKEVLFGIVKRKDTPSEIITTLKDKYWGEDTPEINQLIEEIKINMKPGAANNNIQVEEDDSSNNNDEYNQVNELIQSFSYTITDNYIPQPLSGTINACNKKEAYDQLVDIYTDELGVSESDLEITIKEPIKMKEKYGIHYQDIRTESDFYTWTSGYDPSNIEVEFTKQFMYVYTFGNFTKQLNLQVFNKSELSSICSELGIPQKGI